MNQLINKILLLAVFLCPIVSIAQSTDKEKFEDALYYIDENRYSTALPLLLEVYENDKNNANINYNIGLSILNSFNEKEIEGALPYLQEASKNVSTRYVHLNAKEDRAPIETWYYLGKAQHNDYQFLEAIESLEKFRSFVNDKHYLYKEIDKSISMARYAQKAVLNPVNIKTTNLGNLLNGFYPDFSPVVRIDESAIYYTSRRLREDSSNYEIYDPIDGMMYEDLYVSFNDNGVWSEPMPLNINTEGHEATVNLSIDGQTLYIYKDINGNGELYQSVLEDDSAGIETWGEPQKLGSNINTKAYETHVTITPDGRKLYFISDRDGGLGGKDIYYCNLLPTGGWALAQNAGPILNTDHNEDGVFMHPDGKTLYFSSDGHESMGGYDIMYSVYTDSGWTSPVNMGYPINSVDDDVFFVTTPDGKRAYFSSFKEEGYGEKDVYMLELVDAEEVGLTLYRGEFTFVDRNVPPSGAQVTITNNYTGELVGVYTPRQRDGQFSAILEPNSSYHFVYEADAYEPYEEDIYVSEAGNYQEIYKDIKLKPVRVGEGLEKITPAPLQTADIKGGLVKRGTPVKQMKIMLLDEEENLLDQTVSDDLGEFQFAKLDPSYTYLIRVISEDGNPLQGYDVEVENDLGEILAFEPLDDTTYIFVPSLQPYEFYGIRAKSIAGKIKKEGIAVPGLNVRLEDDKSELIQEEETDQYGEFNFEKLNLDKEYKMVFEGEFPDDPEILITDDLGREMAFKKISQGVYKYVPVVKPLPKGRLSDIAGALTSNSAPVNNLQVLLLDQNMNLINSAATDNVGKFNFEDLDLTKHYTIRFEGNYPDDLKLVVLNSNNDFVLFSKVKEGEYRYTPVFVRLINYNEQTISEQITDNAGEFNYKKLKIDQSYTIIYDGDFPDDEEIFIVNNLGERLKFEKIADGQYKYTPPGSVYVFAFTSNGIPLRDTYVRIEDEKRSLIDRIKTDSIGKFEFRKLPIDKEFWVVIEDTLIDNTELVITKDLQEALSLLKESDFEYRYIPPSMVRLEDAGSKVLGQEETDSIGEFNYQKLAIDKYYRIVYEDDFPDDEVIKLLNDDGKELAFKRVRKGIYEYIPKGAFNLQSYTIDVKDTLDFKETYPRPEELKNVIAYYQRYFIYNAKDINENNKEFVKFINDIAKLVEIRGFADIIITSSASKVPTKTWKTNSILTRKRAYDTKALLERIFAARGIKQDQYNFVDINTLITGPEYKYDYIENRTTYEKYQYVRIFIK